MSQVQSAHHHPTASASVPLAWRIFVAPMYLALAFAALHVLDKHFPVAIWMPMPWSMLGWGPTLVGCGLCAAGAGQFFRQRTTMLPRHASRVLVTGGVFRLTRNPMYLGMAVILVGVSFIAGSASVWIVPPVFVVLIDRHLIRAEEAMLAQRFGEAYRAYRRRVRRWL